jgi:hypothetical protein
MGPEELETLLEGDTKVKVAGIDADGVLRGKVMGKEKFLSAVKSGFGFCREDVFPAVAYNAALFLDGTCTTR